MGTGFAALHINLNISGRAFTVGISPYHSLPINPNRTWFRIQNKDFLLPWSQWPVTGPLLCAAI